MCGIVCSLPDDREKRRKTDSMVCSDENSEGEIVDGLEDPLHDVYELHSCHQKRKSDLQNGNDLEHLATALER